MNSIIIHFLLMYTIRASVFKIINQKNCKINFNYTIFLNIERDMSTIIYSVLLSSIYEFWYCKRNR